MTASSTRQNRKSWRSAKSDRCRPRPRLRTLLSGTKAHLNPGDLLKPGYSSNFGEVVGEVLDWEPHSPEVLQDMRDHLEELKGLGIEAIND